MTIEDVVELLRQRASEERDLAIRYEADGFPLAAMPHDVVCAAMENLVRTVVIMDQHGGYMDE